MTKPEYIKELDNKLLLLETQVKHLTNDLRLTKEENEISMRNYFEIYSDMERKIEERTRDIKELQKILEEKGRELEMMIDSSPGMIFYKDVEQRLIRVNKKFAEILDLPIKEIIGKKYNELFPKNKDHGLESDLEVIQKGKPILNKKELFETLNDQRQIVIDRIPIKDHNNNVTGLIGFALDVTALKTVEEEKKKLEAQLQHAQKMESIGTLAGGIAHNFNNLLMTILGNVSLMLLEINPEHSHYKKLKNIEKQVNGGATLTNQLLGYAREGSYEAKTISLNRLAMETSNTFATTRKEIKVHQELDENLLRIKVDEGQVEQILLNLFVNAADAMPRGGDLFLKTMNVTYEDMKGKAYKPKPGNYALLIVRDTGIGMEKKTMDRIFEPFFTTKGLAKSTGLGLASVYGIIKGHGGYIDVDSQMGYGTTFSIYLPAITENPKGGKEYSGEVSMEKGMVLLVDDEDMVVDIGEQMLAKLGYGVLLARGGREALDLFKKNTGRIDLVLLDMIMPDMGGGDTYDRLKEVNPNLKVLLSSGYSIDGQAKEILERGCDGFIQKPFNLQDLSKKMVEILDSK